MANDNIQWTSEQMIQNASNWSLAGDVAVLNSLKKFSKTLLTDTESLNSKVDNLLNNLENVSLRLELTKNEFQSLRNTQFIENRVYEDDETFESEELKVEEKKLTEEEKENAITNSISKGLKIMETFYDKVELAVSDSEGDEKSYVLQRKDLYADRPLPYLVGSEDWYKKWHVGLLPSDSESESEKEEDVYSSSSDSEELKNRVLGSESSSELDFANKNTGPVANSTFNDSIDHRRDVFHSSDEGSEQSNSLPVKTPISNEKFAEELAAKLGDVIHGKTDTPEDFIKPTARIGNMFSNEPPPVDSLDDTVLPESAHKGLFTGSRNLFAENVDDDDLFWGPQQGKTNATKGMPEVQKAANSRPSSSNVSKPKVTKGLFDNSDSSSEEDMLTVADKRRTLSSNTANPNPYMQAYNKTTLPYLDDEPPEITPKNESGASKKKPVGGVSVFGNNPDIFAKRSTSQKQQDDRVQVAQQAETSAKKISLFDQSSDEDMFTPKPKPADIRNAPNTRKKLDLFDDSDDLTPKNQQSPKASKESKNLFENKESSSKIITAKPKGLFGEAEYKNIDIFRPSSQEIKHKVQEISKPPTIQKVAPKKISLFDDDDDFFKEEDIFASVPKKKSAFGDIEDQPSKTSSRGLFDDLEESIDDHKVSTSKTQSLFEDLDSSMSESGYSNLNDGLLSKSAATSTSEREQIKKTTKGLFDDFDSPEDNSDLFAPPKPAVARTEKKPESVKVAAHNVPKNVEGLFGDEENKTDSKKSLDAFVDNNASMNIDTNNINASVTVKEAVDEEKSFHVEGIRSGPVEDIKNQPKDAEVRQIPEENTSKMIFDDFKTEGNQTQHVEGDQKKLIEGKKGADDLKQDKKEVLGKIRKNWGLFDSESEKSSDEDIFNENDKDGQNKEVRVEDLGASSNVGLASGTSIMDDFKPDEDRQSSRTEQKPKETVSDSGPSQIFPVPPPISLFDPTPPPLDWDAASDNSGDSDTFSLTDGLVDRTSYNQSQPTASSLFDEAPPSLDVHDMNYSSGIVRDINVTRVDTDDSSFHPHASSTRRLSSDIFGEQQSQDSFFMTKNQTDSMARVSNFEKILENSEDVTSKIENLTPSGNIADFDGSSSVFERSEQDSIDEMNKAESIMHAKKSDVSKIVSLFSGDVPEDESDKDDAKKPDVPSVKTSPGKLKHKLNINVGALLPGAARPRIRTPVAESPSQDEPDKSSAPPDNVAFLRPKPAIRINRPKSEILISKDAATTPDEGAHFESLSETGVLQSVTKDRARIPVKRKPSSRRARQEAVRKSMVDFNLYTNEESSPLDDDTAPKEENDAKQVPEPVKSSFLSDLKQKLKTPDDNTENYNSRIANAGVSEESPPVNKGISLVFDKKVEDKQTSIENTPTSHDDGGLFDTPRTEDNFKAPSIIDDVSKPKDDLFESSSKSLDLFDKRDLNTKRSSLFEDLVDDSQDLFKSSIKKTERKSLFDGSNEDSIATGKASDVAPTSTLQKVENITSTADQSVLSRDKPTNLLRDSYDTRGSSFATITEAKKPDNLFDASHADRSLFRPADKPMASDIKKNVNIFGEDEDSASGSSDEDLFSNASRKSKTSSIIKPSVIPDEKLPPKNTGKLGLFSDKSDSDNEIDLFGAKSKISTGQSEKVKSAKALPRNSSIFDDSGDSEDDLFGSKSSKRSRAPGFSEGASSNPRRVEVKTATVKKLENKEATDFDPLSGFR